jgi:hypothetical protein
MNRLAIAVLLALPLSADSNITYSVSATLQQSPCSQTISVFCQALQFTIPQFSGTGTLSEVDWSFSDFQEVLEGIDTLYEPNTGQAWEVTWTGGASSDVLGLDTSGSSSESFVLYSNGAQEDWPHYFRLSASGAAPDVSPFVGDGSITVDITPFAYAQQAPWLGIAWAEDISDTASLTVTYVDPPAVPEPRGIVFVGLPVLLAGAVAVRLRPA